MVKESTRKKIEEAIRHFDYHPKAAARSLKSKLTHRIGIVPVISSEDNRADDPGDDAFLELLAGINTIAAENGYDLLLSAVTSAENEMTILKRLIGEEQVDGMIIQGIRSGDERLLYMKKKKFPFVSYGQSDLPIQYPFVDVDGESGMIKAVRYLAELGHTRIAYITPPNSLMCTSQRWKGFVEGMRISALPIRDEFILEGDFSGKTGKIAGEKLLALDTPPTAILTSNDSCAFGLIQTLEKAGLKPGKDISVIGFDDVSLAAHWQPGLTTIAQPFRKIGFCLMKTLLEVIQGENSWPHVMLDPELIIRDSTGKARG